MARKTQAQTEAPSSEVAVPEVSDEDTEYESAELVERSAEQIANWVTERGFGPNTIQLIQHIAARAVDSADLNSVIVEQLATRLLAATTPEDVLTPFDPTHGADLYGKTVEILSAEFLESDFGEGFPWYASLQIRRTPTGPTEAATIGGETLVLQVGAMDAADMFPVLAKVVRSEKKTKAGFYPVSLTLPTS